MFPSLIWAICALAIPLSVAERSERPVEWVDLMIATSSFPRFFGEVTNINRTGPPRVAAVLFNTGSVEPITCRSTAEGFRCDADCGDCGTVPPQVTTAIGSIQVYSPPPLDGLTFIAQRLDSLYMEDGAIGRTSSFWQSDPAGKIPIDNTIMQINICENVNGSLSSGPEPNRYKVYNGELDEGPSEPSCNEYQARDTAAQAALKQPFWDALYPAAEYKLVYTVQDGRPFLTWRVTFDLTDEVSDSFQVWVNARNCSQIIAAASTQMDNYTHSLGDFKTQQKRLFEDRGIPLKIDPADPSRIIL